MVNANWNWKPLQLVNVLYYTNTVEPREKRDGRGEMRRKGETRGYATLDRRGASHKVF